MTLRILNDLHIGAIRAGGTTAATQVKLRETLLDFLQTSLQTHPHDDWMILGDLFDTDRIPEEDLFQTFRLFHKWLEASEGARTSLWLVAGNHDLPKSSNRLSSFQILARVLQQIWGNRVQIVEAPTAFEYGYIIPHLPNQALFDQALRDVPKCHTLFLHCNYDNNFAAVSDQSLNLSAEQAEAVPSQYIVIGHEHQMRKIGSRIIIPGNQVPSSVSDCLRTDAKYAVSMNPGQEPELSRLCAIGVYLDRMDWNALEPSHCPFIRVEGRASEEEAARVVELISRYRANSPALVISNAVQIASSDQSEEFAATLESVKAFDVLAALKEVLTKEEFAVVENLLE